MYFTHIYYNSRLYTLYLNLYPYLLLCISRCKPHFLNFLLCMHISKNFFVAVLEKCFKKLKFVSFQTFLNFVYICILYKYIVYKFKDNIKFKFNLIFDLQL